MITGVNTEKSIVARVNKPPGMFPVLETCRVSNTDLRSAFKSTLKIYTQRLNRYTDSKYWIALAVHPALSIGKHSVSQA